MKRLLLAGAFLPLLIAQAPRVGIVDFYGLRKIPAERILKAIAVKEGEPLPGSKGALEDLLERFPGVVRSRVEAVCCESGDAILFIGIEEKGAPHFAPRTAPAGEARLPDEVVDTWRRFTEALESAARTGRSAEDWTRGHSLLADPEARGLQEGFAVFAELNPRLVRSVLRTSSDAEHRAIAAYVMGYAPTKRLVTDDLQYALQDPESAVRQNALSALGAIAVLASRDPDLDIRVTPTWFTEMLHSIVLSDRTRAVMALLILTEQRSEKVLGPIRERAIGALVEMARWKSLKHAVGPFTLVGRLAELSDSEIESAWERGDRESVIAKALNARRRR
ncbi:MAG: HEAT repeat domain-containing protein [Bryobacteraceae bacterium]